jgi:hypothetical protein
MPHYRAAGEKMTEAKQNFVGRHEEFKEWIERSFGRSYTTARRYMSYAESVANETNRRARHTSLSEFVRESGGSPRGAERGGVAWQEPDKQIMNKVDVDTLNLRQAEMKRADERDAQRQLALQLIDIGYKALATKLHPDKGGSRDAMSRLNQVRDRLKQHA